MKTILIANSKGGSGKTTTAVSLASAWACAGLKTTLVDADPQKSATQWLKRRSVYCAHIDRTDWAGRAETLQFAKGTQRVIIDSPSALTSKQISEKFGNIDAMVVPLSSSLFDEIATKKFLSSLQRLERVNHGETHIHVVTSRLNPRARATAASVAYLQANGYAPSAQISSRTAYVELAHRGQAIFDMPQKIYDRAKVEWQPLLAALDAV